MCVILDITMGHLRGIGELPRIIKDEIRKKEVKEIGFSRRRVSYRFLRVNKRKHRFTEVRNFWDGAINFYQKEI